MRDGDEGWNGKVGRVEGERVLAIVCSYYQGALGFLSHVLPDARRQTFPFPFWHVLC